MKFKVLSLICIFIFVACDNKSRKPNIEIVQNMMDSPAFKAQDYDPNQPGGAASRMPPEGTVAIGKPPYPYRGQPEQAGRNLTNPVRVEVESLARGAELYQIYCLVCHGPKGRGDGTVTPKLLVPPPSLLEQKARDYSDGRLYHIIVDGQGMMGAYDSQILEKDRWKIVNYIRQLQKENRD